MRCSISSSGGIDEASSLASGCASCSMGTLRVRVREPTMRGLRHWCGNGVVVQRCDSLPVVRAPRLVSTSWQGLARFVVRCLHAAPRVPHMLPRFWTSGYWAWHSWCLVLLRFHSPSFCMDACAPFGVSAAKGVCTLYFGSSRAGAASHVAASGSLTLSIFRMVLWDRLWYALQSRSVVCSIY